MLDSYFFLTRHSFFVKLPCQTRPIMLDFMANNVRFLAPLNKYYILNTKFKYYPPPPYIALEVVEAIFFEIKK